MSIQPYHFAIAGVLIFGSSSAHCALTSHYTDLAGAACTRHIDDVTTGASTTNCPGVYGFRVLVHQDDERSSVSVVTPNRRVLPLNYWDVVTHSFSTLGRKAEWRIENSSKKRPIGLIVHMNVLSEDLPYSKSYSLLIVARIGRRTACVTHQIDASVASAIDLARKAADEQRGRCMVRQPASSDTVKTALRANGVI